MRDDVFVHKIIEIVDPKFALSAPEVIKLVEEKFTSTNSTMVPCSHWMPRDNCKLRIHKTCGTSGASQNSNQQAQYADKTNFRRLGGKRMTYEKWYGQRKDYLRAEFHKLTRTIYEDVQQTLAIEAKVREGRPKLGDKVTVRSWYYSYGQGDHSETQCPTTTTGIIVEIKDDVFLLECSDKSREWFAFAAILPEGAKV